MIRTPSLECASDVLNLSANHPVGNNSTSKIRACRSHHHPSVLNALSNYFSTIKNRLSLILVVVRGEIPLSWQDTHHVSLGLTPLCLGYASRESATQKMLKPFISSSRMQESFHFVVNLLRAHTATDCCTNLLATPLIEIYRTSWTKYIGFSNNKASSCLLCSPAIHNKDCHTSDYSTRQCSKPQQAYFNRSKKTVISLFGVDALRCNHGHQ